MRLPRATLVTLLAVPTLALTATPASSAVRDDPAPSKSAAASSSAQERVRQFWTPERMASARPMEINRRARVNGPLPEAGTPTVVEPLRANSPGEPWTAGGAVTRTEGRVFFTYQGRTASCSGNAVTSVNKSVVITAGHCVKLDGAYHTNWAFVPGYNSGNAPYGTWAATTLLTTPQWHASEDINYDVAAAVVAPLNGQRLTDVVGAQGIAFNQARGQLMYAFGHPAASPYDGSRLIYCSGTAINDFLLSNDLGLRCNMTGGSSGGPWFLSFSEATGTGIVNSVNSFKYNFLPSYMFGPYFGNDAQNVYNTAQNS
ncbi:trypsin-like serine peptidase [Nonomuraea soli]|uniref:V8-like Glu-specific endopeptidase n=1 Tax=Nonomuraea soli TaxID=1032476 RepID=A0A7W0HVP5_9ACTN|nr:peptidase [Nonomuraea soli]MBA2897444.1 V8-like Glu-specific endopeptidase [Nonomuraea soli]